MNKVFFLAIVACFAASMNFVYATKPGEIAVGIQGGIGLPQGDFGDGFGMGSGGLASFQYAINSNLVLTGTVGYLTFNAKNSTSTVSGTYDIIPILPGIRYIVGENSFAPYIGSDIGLFSSTYKSSMTLPFIGKQENSSSASDFGIAPLVGFYMSMGNMQLDANLKYNVIFTENKSTSFIGINAGLKFPL